MRLPTFTELYYNVATYHPNPNLKPETAMMARLTAEAAGKTGRSGSWKVAASGWYRHTRDVIDWEQRPSTDPNLNGHWWSTQLNRLGTVGAELSAYYATEGWMRVAMLNYGYIHSDMTVTTGYISKYALDYMRHKLSAVFGVAFLRGFTFTLTGSFYDRVGSYIAADGTQQGYQPYFLLDGRLAWELPETGRDGGSRRGGVQLYLDVTNMTDTRYFDFGGLAMPGPWATAGVVVTLK
jgi:iron complex outermembrane receptor protein